MRIVFRIICVLLLHASIMVVAVQAASSRTISYQGYLKDASGVPVNGAVTMILRIYDTAKEGTTLWTEKRDVLVTSGIYQINLGEVTALDLPFDQQYWLGIAVSGDPEMQPRQQLSHAPYAFRSTVADSVPDKSVAAAKIGQICADGDVLRYDSQSNSWRCNPVSGGFPASLPMAGALTVQGITTALVSPAGPDPNKDLILYGFDLQLSLPSGGKLTAGPLKITCDPKMYAPLMTQSIASVNFWPVAGLWLKGSDGLYARYIELDNVAITAVKPIPPTRPGEQTLVEYTLNYTALRFKSPSNPIQTATIDLMKSSLSGCTHPSPVFSVTHGLPVDLGTMFGTVYPISSYSYGVVSGSLQAKPSFSTVSVSGPLGSDGPCFMTDMNGKHFQTMTIHTAAPQSTAGNILLESRLRLSDVYMNSYRLHSSGSGTIEQEMSFVPAEIYWGYYPVNPDKMVNDPIVEKGWNIFTSTAL